MTKCLACLNEIDLEGVVVYCPYCGSTKLEEVEAMKDERFINLANKILLAIEEPFDDFSTSWEQDEGEHENDN